MRVRAADFSDVAAMGRLTVETFLVAHRGQIPEEVWDARRANWTPTVSAQAWDRTLRRIADGAEPDQCVYVAEEGMSEIVGLAMGARKDRACGHLAVLYVSPSHCRRGIGAGLVREVAAFLLGRGMFKLRTEAFRANEPARRFYEALGGQVVSETEVEEEGVLVPVVVYEWPDLRVL